jgi:predicted O-linked N-acetylglucosamine transferase (SPINDLY family)
MLLQKLHPDFDDLIRGILSRDPQGVVVLFQDKHLAHRRLIEKRFELSLAAFQDRIIFVPFLPIESLKMLLLQSHVVLDPPHFGGGTTVFIVAAMGVPIVSMEGSFNRSRSASACYQQMGIPEVVTHSAEEYVERAVSIANDPALRQQIREKILANNHMLFDGTSFVAEFAAWLTSISAVPVRAAS